MSAWDRRLSLRAASIAAVTAAAALLIIAATDDGAAWARRLGMWAALCPVAGALGAVAAVRLARSRGELRALEAIGAAPDRVVLGAVLGGVAIGLLGPVLAGSPLCDLAALFPRPALARVWVVDGEALRELTLGLRVGADGALQLAPGAIGALEPPLPPGAARGAVAALAAAALTAPAWAALRADGPRKPWIGGIAVVALIVAFQAVAAGRAHPAVLVLAPLIPLVDLAAARYRSRSRPVP